MSKFVNLHGHTHSSLLDGLTKSHEVAKVCSEYGQTACAITDHGTISGAPTFVEELKKKNIKPILGSEFYICQQPSSIKDSTNKKLSHLVTLSKNLDGWKNLIKLTTISNSENNFYYKPRLNLDDIAANNNGNLVSFSGHPGSDLCNIMIDCNDNFYDSESIENVKLKPTAYEDAKNLALRYQDIFGKGNFFLEIQLIDSLRIPGTRLVADILRQVSKDTGIPCVATADFHYARRTDAIDQRVLLCSSLGRTLNEVYSAINKGEDVPLGGFFKSENYFIPNEEYMLACGNTQEEIENTALIASMCENYNILSQPKLPKFKWTEGLSEIDYLKKLCRIGWRKRKTNLWNEQIYADRVKMELEVIERNDLTGYFLIVNDYVNWAKMNGILVGHGRGSIGGSLVAYLLGIIEIDPIKCKLIFERFYNDGRNTPGRVSLPDIDVDFPTERRQDVIAYIKSRYGHESVLPMATFGRMQGRGALKDVLRIHEVCDNLKANEITKNIPHEHEIEEFLVDEENPSILRWTLENEPKILGDYARIDDNGNITGEYAQYVEQAIRLEGTFKSKGCHAAGIIISSDNLREVCPISKGGKYDEVIEFDMEQLEKMGHVKFDILGLLALSKLQGISRLLKTGKII